MKSTILTLSLAGLLSGSLLPLEARPEATQTISTPNAEAWKTPDKLRKKLADEISARLESFHAKAIRDFGRNKENMRLLLMYYLAVSESHNQQANTEYNNNLQQNIIRKKDQVAGLEREVKEKKGPEKKNAEYRLSNTRNELKKAQREARHSIDPTRYRNVLRAILADPDWMEQIAFSGEMHRFARVVEIINAIAGADGAALQKGVERDTTTAIALEYAKGGFATEDAVERARYYLKYWRQGRLNTTFDTLPMHHRRIVCGWKPGHNSGTIKAFEWALNNVHLPDWQYPASCWRCGYVLNNVYGDSIHGPHYYAPWAGVYSDNHMALAKYVGAVCGGLSHFGAAAACANGVPALAAGEPGHCAYIVLVKGKWTPAYSLSWERGLHWQPWSNNYTYSSLHLTDELYSKKNAAQTRYSNACRILAQLCRDREDTENALACYKLAAKAAPLNYPMWKEYADFLGKHLATSPQAWQKLNESLCRGMASQYPEQAALLLQQGILDKLTGSGISAQELAEACALFWQNASGMGPDRWHVEHLTDAQLKACKRLSGDSEESIIGLYVRIMSAAAPHDAYSGSMMAWGNKLSSGLSERGRKAMSDAMVKALSTGKNINSSQKAKLLGGLILAAEKAGDTTTFHAISKMIDPAEIHGTAAIPAPTPFPGKLVSEGGLPFASSTSEWDAPHTHSGLLTQKGGRIHTGKDTNAWIAVKLPRHAYLSGVVFAGTNEWKLIHRFRPMRVQVSDTGRPDDWHDVGAPIENTGNYINRFDLQQERPKALYVRVLRSGGPEFFHANGIYVYGTPAA